MKYPTGFLCAAAVLVLVWADESLERDTAKQWAHPSGEKPSSGHSNIDARATDPARALVQAFTLEIGSERENRIRDLLSAWALRDAEAALGWVSAVEDPAARRSARSTVCLAVAEKDPRRAVTLALAHGTDQDDDCGLLECLTMQWCEKESEAALNWTREQPPGEWRDRLLARASFVLSKSDPAEAARLVSGLEPGTVQDEAAMAVLHQWALKDSSAALRWAEAFSEPTLRERALAEISNLRNLTTSLREVR
ncbi:MAG: hypothetical protein ABIS50_10030 [Luteolibacter sp.]|uniref:hypothetical protein n=1 Tax=Luteolibacter sp. TaxID=1962973 RepID=UPI003262CED6